MSPNGQFAFWQSVERREGELAAKLTVNYRGHTSILPLQVMNKLFNIRSERSNAVFDVLIRVDKGVIKIIKVKSIPMMDLLQMMSRGVV